MTPHRHGDDSRWLDVSVEELEAILDQADERPLTPEEREQLSAAFHTLVYVLGALKEGETTAARLRKLLGITRNSEKTADVVGDAPAPDAGNDPPAADEASEQGEGEQAKDKPKRPGHGRNGADAYVGALKIEVPHPELKVGQPCPKCDKGKLYGYRPQKLVRLHGQAPIAAVVYEKQTLRCKLCSEVYNTPSPEGVGDEKYDASCAAMLGLLRYGTGVPLNRMERFQKGMGIPLPDSTQWDIIEKSAIPLAHACDELVRQGAQGDVLFHDDTKMKILTLMKENAEIIASGDKHKRTGMVTSAIVSTMATGQQIALFITGRQHAGENLSDLLKHRAEGLDPPIQMADGSLNNTADKRTADASFNTILANCLAHGRRKFVDLYANFPQECRHVLETLREVYRHDAFCRTQGLSPPERLQHHQEHNEQRMTDLQTWMKTQLESRQVEENSPLGKAFLYMLKRWPALTVFLRKEGAPLDNNIAERALKKAVIQRKNSLFYKTENGARVGDIFLSLIHTAELAAVSPFAYLTALLEHSEALSANPGAWMPWNYQDALTALAEKSTT